MKKRQLIKAFTAGLYGKKQQVRMGYPRGSLIVRLRRWTKTVFGVEDNAKREHTKLLMKFRVIGFFITSSVLFGCSTGDDEDWGNGCENTPVVPLLEAESSNIQGNLNISLETLLSLDGLWIGQFQCDEESNTVEAEIEFVNVSKEDVFVFDKENDSCPYFARATLNSYLNTNFDPDLTALQIVIEAFLGEGNYLIFAEGTSDILQYSQEYKNANVTFNVDSDGNIFEMSLSFAQPVKLNENGSQSRKVKNCEMVELRRI